MGRGCAAFVQNTHQRRWLMVKKSIAQAQSKSRQTITREDHNGPATEKKNLKQKRRKISDNVQTKRTDGKVLTLCDLRSRQGLPAKNTMS